jgi:Voltage-dependent anion channel
MATGIISVGTELLGFHLLSNVSLWITGLAFVVLLFLYLVRAFVSRQQFEVSLRDPRAGMAFFWWWLEATCSPFGS